MGNLPNLAGKVTELDVFRSVRVSWVLEYETHDQPVGIGFLNFKTRIRPPEQSDRVAASRVQLGWVGLSGGWVGWTP